MLPTEGAYTFPCPPMEGFIVAVPVSAQGEFGSPCQTFEQPPPPPVPDVARPRRRASELPGEKGGATCSTAAVQTSKPPPASVPRAQLKLQFDGLAVERAASDSASAPSTGRRANWAGASGNEGGAMERRVSKADSDDSTAAPSPMSTRGRVSWADMSDDEDLPSEPLSFDEVSEVGSEACPTMGSIGHRAGQCAAPCKFAFKSRGCKEGASCRRCHLCHFTRAANRARA